MLVSVVIKDIAGNVRQHSPFGLEKCGGHIRKNREIRCLNGVKWS
jgi:hypothetical protein